MKILDTKIGSALSNMTFDRQLLEQLDPFGEPILHLYGWEGLSATYGHFIEPHQWFDLQKVEETGVSLARRPTGGGIVFHIWDLAFSFLMPSNHSAFSSNTLENYRFVNEVVLDVVKEKFSLADSVELIAANAPSSTSECTHFCMARPTQYDVIYQGMKIAGAAQRRKKEGYLHQGTISLAAPDQELLYGLLPAHPEVVQAMSLYTFSPLGKNPSFDALSEVRQDVQHRLQEKFVEKLQAIAYTS
ncbi:MAG: lipoate--protein ligase family protein [Chlamydiales bacterium]|nr:lipoate--protein ligase family protein [Chlamydiales bacterium]